jgi:single-stranded DNA-specific DHH superfamily exonuclease
MNGHAEKLKKVDLYTKEQKKLHKGVVGSIDTKKLDLTKNPNFIAGQKFVQDMLNPSSASYNKFSAPYLNDFRSTVTGLSDRFGGGDKSGFARGVGQSSERLQENLNALKTQGMMSASNQALDYAQAPAQMNMGLVQSSLNAQPFGYQVIPGEQSTKSKILGGLARGGATAAGAYFGGPMGAMAVNQAWG